MAVDATEATATSAATAAPVAAQEDRAKARGAKNKLMDDGRPATLAELGDARRDLSKNERIKLEKPGLAVWDDIINKYSKEGFDSITEDDMERFKWYGIYQQRPKDGYFMMRLKVPGGALNVAQMREVAALSRQFARGIADITTRQDFQMHWLTIENIPEIVTRLQNVGLTTRGACGDISRNICGSPLSGIDPNEVIDPLSFIQEANEFFINAHEYADLPRKHKMLVVGSPDTGQIEINGIAMYGMKRNDDGTVGYGVRVGGGLSTEPHLAQDLGVFVEPGQALAVLEMITKIYRDHGYRKNRKHARLKYLVADWGAEKFRAKLEEYLGYTLRDAEGLPSSSRGYQDELGVHDQVQDGLQWIGVPVVAGRMTSDQIDAVADLAEEFGSGDVRLTVMQNLYLINIPRENVSSVLRRLDEIELPVETTPVRRGVVACTGIEFCNLAVTETKHRARNIVNLLDEGVTWSESEFFRINVNGCPNSCGQHWIADVGLQGCTKKVDGELKEHFDVFLGGALGNSQSGGARFNRRVKRIMAEEVAPSIQRAISHYQANRQGNESFADFCARHTDEQLAEIL